MILTQKKYYFQWVNLKIKNWHTLCKVNSEGPELGHIIFGDIKWAFLHA